MKKITHLLMLLTVTFGFSQAPTTNPPAPTNAPADVVSIYGDTYTSIATNFNPNWGQSGFAQVTDSFDPGTGELLLAYPNFNYQGTDLTPSNLSQMEYLHIDIWTPANPANTDIKVSPINNGSGAPEVLVSIAYTSGTWTSVDIPKSSFSGMTWDSVIQMKFAANGAGSTVPVDVYLDNIYFWKTPPPAGSDATLSALEIDGTPLAGFSSITTDYTFELPAGTTTVPQITSATSTDPNATSVTINQATSLPGDATVVVVSENGTVTETYTISFVAVGPSVAAPTPPARPTADVISIFSNAYADINVDTFDTPWCGATTTEVSIQGDAVKKVSGLGCEGVEFVTGRFDATGFTHFHIDFFTDTPTLDKSFNVKFSNWNNGTQEANAIELSITNANFLTNPNPGTWYSIDVPLNSFTPINNASINDVVQFVITSNLGTVYYDNLYLHKDTVLSTQDFKINDFKVYPNPTANNWNINSNQDINSIQLFDVLGKQVLTLQPNSKDVIINSESLKSGLYFAKINSNRGTKTIKLVKE